MHATDDSSQPLENQPATLTFIRGEERPAVKGVTPSKHWRSKQISVSSAWDLARALGTALKDPHLVVAGGHLAEDVEQPFRRKKSFFQPDAPVDVLILDLDDAKLVAQPGQPFDGALADATRRSIAERCRALAGLTETECVVLWSASAGKEVEGGLAIKARLFALLSVPRTLSQLAQWLEVGGGKRAGLDLSIYQPERIFYISSPGEARLPGFEAGGGRIWHLPGQHPRLKVSLSEALPANPFALPPATPAQAAAAGLSQAIAADSILQALQSRSLLREALSEPTAGKWSVRCPWVETHSDGRDDGAVYMQAGWGGHVKPAFKCWHAHCAGKALDQALEAWGIVTPGGVVPGISVELPTSAGQVAAPAHPLREPGQCAIDPADWPDPAYGKQALKATISNIRLLTDRMGATVRYDEMRHRIHAHLPSLLCSAGSEEESTRSWVASEAMRHGINNDGAINRAVTTIAKERSYHPVEEWLGLPRGGAEPRAAGERWDGVDRFERLFETLELNLEGEDLVFAARCLRRWLYQLPYVLGKRVHGARYGRAELVLVLQGPQNIGKSTWVTRLLPAEAGGNLSTGGATRDSVQLGDLSKDFIMDATNVAIGELAEFDGIARKADVARLKAWLSKESDTYRPPYGASSVTVPRTTIFAATVNPTDFLQDRTGNRRFAVLPVRRAHWEALEGKGKWEDKGLDRRQLWLQLWHEVWVAGERPFLARGETQWLMLKAESYRSAAAMESQIDDEIAVLAESLHGGWRDADRGIPLREHWKEQRYDIKKMWRLIDRGDRLPTRGERSEIKQAMTREFGKPRMTGRIPYWRLPGILKGIDGLTFYLPAPGWEEMDRQAFEGE